MATNGNANAVPFIRNSNLFRKRIMDALVCWYDIGKQQCTNESMAANPVLADLSGNGHDIECFNFAWAGMSGIGGYIYDSSNLYSTPYSKISDNIITIINNEGAISGAQIAAKDGIIGKKGETLTYTIKAFDIKVSNLPDGMYFQVGAAKNNGNKIEWVTIENCSNGITHIDERTYTIEPYDSESTPSLIDFRTTFTKELASVENIADLGITIEILPLYPNALVSDGVDDYCYTDGLPILTDYTVIAKRSYQGFEQNLKDNNIALAGKTTASENGAFMLERLLKSGIYAEYSFGAYNHITLHNDIITYATKFSYNGVQKLNAGELPDTDTLHLFTKATGNSKVQAALYSFLLFDRTLTTAEIEWVKQNMIESGGVLKTNWADSSLWKNYLDGSRGIGVVKSAKLIINTNIIGVSALFETIGERTIDSFTIKVTGLQNDIIMYYKYYNGSTDLLLVTMIEDGVYTLPQVSGRYIGFMFNKKFENENIVIQQLLS